ncbi:MAG TPA: hypothetical protein VJY37_02335, partial [Anaerovoracaceae bacterium]|nr:hypothetical protein [Anaerovoracaceae bacterium]
QAVVFDKEEVVTSGKAGISQSEDSQGSTRVPGSAKTGTQAETGRDLETEGGKPEVEPVKGLTDVKKAKTGEPFKAIMYNASGRTDNSVYGSVNYPVMGKGKYYAFNAKKASTYGPNVVEEVIELKNPLIIRDDVDWRRLTTSAGWEYSNPVGQDRDKIIADIDKLQGIARESGHDGIVVTFEKDKYGDINDLTNNSIKTLRSVLGHDQAVVFDKEEVVTSGKAGISQSEDSQDGAKVPRRTEADAQADEGRNLEPEGAEQEVEPKLLDHTGVLKSDREEIQKAIDVIREYNPELLEVTETTKTDTRERPGEFGMITEEYQLTTRTFPASDILSTFSTHLKYGFDGAIETLKENLRLDFPQYSAEHIQAAGDLSDYDLTIQKATTKNGNPVWELKGVKKDDTDMINVMKRFRARWWKPTETWSFYGEEDPTPKILAEIEKVKPKKSKPAETKPTGDSKPINKGKYGVGDRVSYYGHTGTVLNDLDDSIEILMDPNALGIETHSFVNKDSKDLSLIKPKSPDRAPETKPAQEAKPEIKTPTPDTTDKYMGFKENDRVKFTLKGKEFTGTIKRLDDYSNISSNLGMVADVDVDQIEHAGGVPIGRREIVRLDTLSKLKEAANAPSNTEETPDKITQFTPVSELEELAKITNDNRVKIGEIIGQSKGVRQIVENINKNTFDGWRNNLMKERRIKKAINDVVQDTSKTEQIFDLIAGEYDLINGVAKETASTRELDNRMMNLVKNDDFVKNMVINDSTDKQNGIIE